MVKRLWTRVVGAIIFAIVTAVGYSLDVAQITNLNFKWWPLIGFVVFIGLVVWIFIDLHGQINKLIDSKPNILASALSTDVSTL